MTTQPSTQSRSLAPSQAEEDATFAQLAAPLDMISPSVAAGLIGGMTQGTRELGRRWEALSDSQRAGFLEHWAEIIHSGSPDRVALILTSISQHPSLAEAWQSLGSEIHDSRRHLIAAILRDTSSAA